MKIRKYIFITQTILLDISYTLINNIKKSKMYYFMALYYIANII